MNQEVPQHRHPEVPAGVHPEIESQREDPRFRRWWVGGWLSPILVTAFTLLWVFLIYWLIGDRPRDWQYGTMPYVPGESIFAIEPAAPGQAPPQIVLPKETPGGPNENR